MIVVPALVFAARVSWVYAVFNGFKLAAYRKPEVPLSKLIVSGISWFKADNFTEDGRPYQKALLTAFVAFFVCLVLLMVLVMSQAPSLVPQYQPMPR